MKSLKGSILGMGVAMAMLTACNGGQQAPQLTASGLDPAKFDTTLQDKPVKLFTLKNQNGMEVCITNYGARVVSLVVPDKDGKPTDVVLGFDNIAQYADTLNSPTDYGSSVGRYANRICDGKFKLNGETYQLRQNDPHEGDTRIHCLHGGGATGWMNKVYDAEQVDETTLKLTIVAQDGENGFPGTVTAVTTYKVTADNTLDITWEAETDKPTIINQTNHNYYNLSGDLENPGYDQVLYVNADNFTEADFSYMPTGKILPVEGTPMDFRTPHAVGDSIKSEYYQTKNAHGYDHNWCLNTYKDGKGDDTQVCASLYSPKSGIFMEMFTNEPGVQVYSGNFQGVGGEENIVRKLGKKYPQHVSICLESQKFPDSPNHQEWASPVLNPGEKYFSHAAYKFSIK
ncbi:MAG: galactose mutarotase [Prevotella sp.]|nr:galactose mutarotase [Prevotella sp.]